MSQESEDLRDSAAAAAASVAALWLRVPGGSRGVEGGSHLSRNK